MINRLAPIINRYCDDHSVSLAEVARLLDVPRYTIHRWATSDSISLRPIKIREVCEKLGRDPMEALGRVQFPSDIVKYKPDNLAALYARACACDPMSCFELVNLAGLNLFNAMHYAGIPCEFAITKYDAPQMILRLELMLLQVTIQTVNDGIYVRILKGYKDGSASECLYEAAYSAQAVRKVIHVFKQHENTSRRSRGDSSGFAATTEAQAGIIGSLA